ncbi:MAG: DUF1801 domain-containing protein, partial [Thalassobaculaceae bacterium]|nr:DUF1801 domain-containing protein [Thalassobaculaceae bacterium]
ADPAVAAALDVHPQPVRDALLDLRSLILETAAETPDVGQLVETLKWGQPAYLPKRPRIGTTLRIDGLKGNPDGYALFFHCQSRLCETFRERYGDTLTIAGDRSTMLDARTTPPHDALRHCIALALTYHIAKRRDA